MRSSVILKICLRGKIDLWRQRVCDNISIPDAPKQMRNIPPSSITKIEISQNVVADNGLKLKVYKENTLDSYSVEEIRQKDIVDTVFNVSSTNSEQCKLCVNGPLYIDTWLLWKQTIGSNCP